MRFAHASVMLLPVTQTRKGAELDKADVFEKGVERLFKKLRF